MQNLKLQPKNQNFLESELKNLYFSAKDSHKGQNGKLLLIGGSNLFHAASLWSLQVASRIVDMVFYSSVPENNQIVHEAKKEFRNGIVVPREQIESYINEADCVLLGPGMVRTEEKLKPTEDYQLKNLAELNEIEHEGIQTYYLTKFLLAKYPSKKWVIDAGALQMMDPEWLKALNGNVILTPHPKEFKALFGIEVANEVTAQKAKEYSCIIVTKGPTDTVCNWEECVSIEGGNEGMTKGGTGDVLAGLIAALACKNDLFLAAKAGSYINKKAGDSLYSRVGPYFNASDLADEIPKVMKELLVV